MELALDWLQLFVRYIYREIAPADIRGRLVSFNQFMIIFGMLVVYFVNWGIANGETLEWINDVGWRYMFASGVIPAIIFAILLLFVPETPRYLAIQHQDKKALAILTKINGPLEAKAILDDIKQTMAINVSSEKLFSYGKLVIIVGVLLSVFQQFVGINVASILCSRIFESMEQLKIPL